MSIPTVNYKDVKDDSAFWAQYDDCLWGLDESERIHCTGFDEALEEARDAHYETGDSGPKTELILAWRRMKVDVPSHDVLEHVLEILEEEYGDPYGDYVPETTRTMTEAAEAFAAVIEREYKPWACEPVVKVLWTKEGD